MTPKDWDKMKKLLADVAKGNDVQEILSLMEHGVTAELKAPVSAQQFHGMSKNSTATTAVSVEGKGYADFFIRSSGSGAAFSIIVDGVPLLNSIKLDAVGYGYDNHGDETYRTFTVRFSKSIAVKVCGTSSSYTIYADGVVWFEE